MNSSLKNFNCMLNINKFGDSKEFINGYSDHPMMPSINDLLRSSKKEIESFNSLISNLRPNSTLESLMLSDNTIPTLHKKTHFSHLGACRKGHRKKKNNRSYHNHLNYLISTNEDVEDEIAELEREIEAEINENTSAAPDSISRENNQYDIQGIFESISRRRVRLEVANLDEEDDSDFSGILSSFSSNNSSRNSTSHSRSRNRNETENVENDTDNSGGIENTYSDSSDDEDETSSPPSNLTLIDRRNSIFNRMFELALQFAQNDHSNRQISQNAEQNESEIPDIENNNIIEGDVDEETDHDTYNDEDEDNYEDISAIFDSIRDNRDEPSALRTAHANTAILTAAAQLTPAGEAEETISSFNELPDSFTDIIEDELNETENSLEDNNEKEKKKIPKKKSKKPKKSGLPIPGPMTLEEAFDFISFVKIEASKTSNSNDNNDNDDNHNHNGSKKKISYTKDSNVSLSLC